MAYIASSQSALLLYKKCLRKDVRRRWFVRFFRFGRLFFVTNEPSERESVRIDGSGRVGNDGGGRVVLEYVRDSEEN
jgi:hypothetical protein